jgi:hypothetical protein
VCVQTYIQPDLASREAGSLAVGSPAGRI